MIVFLFIECRINPIQLNKLRIVVRITCVDNCHCNAGHTGITCDDLLPMDIIGSYYNY